MYTVYVFVTMHMYMYIFVDSRKALSQREAELLDTSDQCRTLLEDQIAALRKQCASLEHDLTSAREDGKALQSLLKEKVIYTYNTLVCFLDRKGCTDE